MERLIGDDLHATALSIHAIGQGLALANGTEPRHGVKQIDRLSSNAGVDLWELFEPWVLYVIGQRKELVVARTGRSSTAMTNRRSRPIS